MPKHVPTFKHLLASSSSGDQKKKQTPRSVNDLLANSRAQSSARTPRHVVVEPGMGVSGVEDVVESAVLPAEQLRRLQAAQRSLRRTIAGPAPPPSWSSGSVAPNPSPSSSAQQAGGRREPPRRRRVTGPQLEKASAVLSHRLPSKTRLVEHCLFAVLVYLEDETPLALEGEGEGRDAAAVPLCQVMREQVGYLVPHLRSALLDLASVQPENGRRLSDHSLRAVLATGDSLEFEAEAMGQLSVSSTPDDLDSIHKDIAKDSGNYDGEYQRDDSYSNGHPITDDATNTITDATNTNTDTNTDADDDSSTSWDTRTPSQTYLDLAHLALTLHPNPTSFLRLSLQLGHLAFVPTSLNLAYSYVADLGRLVDVLPLSMRELGLCGVRTGSSAEGWRRGLAALGRKMLVIKVLDLSESPWPITPASLVSLLHPPSTRLPSLRRLGLRGALGRMTQDVDPDAGHESSRARSGSIHDVGGGVREAARGARDVATAAQDAGRDVRQVGREVREIAREPREGGRRGCTIEPGGAAGISAGEKETKKRLLEVIRGAGRKRWIEVIWDDDGL